MTNMTVHVSQTNEVVNRIYDLGAKLADAPNFSLHVGRSTSQQETRLIVIGKKRLSPTGIEAQYFATRVVSLFSFFGRYFVPGSLLRGELDAQGYPFLELARAGGELYPITKRTPAEAERRFISVISAVGKFHAEGIWFGDLTPESFMTDAHLEPIIVGLIGLTGPMNLGAGSDGQTAFLSPEVRRGEPSSFASDVFSLSLIGAALLGVEILSKQMIRTGDVFDKLIKADAPKWLAEIIALGLSPNPGDRPSNCKELLLTIREGRDKLIGGALVEVDKRTTHLLDKKGDNPEGVQVFVPAAKTDSEPRRSARDHIGRLIVACGVLGILLVAFVFFRRGAEETVFLSSGNVVIPLLNQAGYSANMTPPERRQFFEKLSKTEDPMVNDAVLILIDKAPSVEDRVAAESWLLDRADRAGMHRVVRIIQSWFGNNPLLRPNGYVEGLRLLDKSAPVSAHEKSLQVIGKFDRGKAIQLASALVMDNGGEDSYRRIFSTVVTGGGSDPDYLKRPVTAIILSVRDARGVFLDELQDGFRSLDKDDLVWLLSRTLPDDDGVLTSRLVAAVVSSQEINDVQKKMLEIAISDTSVPVYIRSAAVRLSGGIVDKKDLDKISSWNDHRSSKLLLLLTQAVSDEGIINQIVSKLVLARINSEPVGGIIEVLGRSEEKVWQRAGRVPGYFFLLSEQGVEEYDLNREVVATAASIPAIVKVVMSSDCSACREAILDVAPEKLSSLMLFDLLRSKEARLRIKALKRLALYEDVGAVNLLRDNFQKEKDESVREVYIKSFPKIFDR